MSSTDPHPELRCRCVSRRQLPEDGYSYRQWPDDYYDRCHRRATQEDGLCDVCRRPEETHPKPEFIYYRLDDPRTECIDYESIREV
jgi:hypothetical protein